jgi:small subunit ribosomal protein S3Ae
MDKIMKQKAQTLTMDQLAQEIVLGKIASDIYNEAKRIAPLRHVGVRSSKVVSSPAQPQVQQAA